jgi:hypothetical protein
VKCPHCLTEFHDDVQDLDLGQDVDGDWGIRKYTCPSPDCQRNIYYLINGKWHRYPAGGFNATVEEMRLVRPKLGNRAALSPEIPVNFKEDYQEACLVLPDSLKASAALSRRCLQNLLREKGKVKPGNLANEIQQIIDSNQLPSHLEESIDAIRNIGNFAAHPSKSESTGVVIPVEIGEAEWNLEVLEMLFDFYFVQPEKTRARKEALNKKLEDMGKPKMK